MSVVRIAFLGTPEFARFHLASLLADNHFEVVGVVTQPDRPSGRHMHLKPSPVKEYAESRGLKVISPKSIKIDSALQEISSWKAEAAVVVAYGQILPQKFLDIFPLKVVNVHASILPRWRGAAPIQRAIEAGDKITGVSLQVMVLKLDAGDVIGSYSLPIDQDMNAFTLHDALMPLGARLLSVDFMDYLRGNLTPQPQDESQVTYAAKIDKAEATINWSRPTHEIQCHIRAMLMGPGSVTHHNDKKLKIWGAHILDKFSVTDSKHTGEICEVGKDYFIVKCKDGFLKVLEVQPESRPKMSVKDYLLGHKLVKGECLQ
ncbi:MAG: methionyl-tRNA formyltransferase [Bdellovibrionales bacterium RBG_16_40_8]|nr:MAG: methionyl-tRNA formyltransferase [Bdellovibrionales bacterium RBG_16_40_8]